MGAVCWQCIEDEHLKKIVKQQGTLASCNLCSKKRKSFNAEQLAEIVDPILREHLSLGEDVKRFRVDDDKGWWEQEGDPLEHHLQEGFIGQYLGFEDEIIEALQDIDPADPRDGEMPFYDSSSNYVVAVSAHPHALHAEWIQVSEDLKHRRRFFSSAASHLFGHVFEDVETRSFWNKETRADTNMPIGSIR